MDAGFGLRPQFQTLFKFLLDVLSFFQHHVPDFDFSSALSGGSLLIPFGLDLVFVKELIDEDGAEMDHDRAGERVVEDGFFAGYDICKVEVGKIAEGEESQRYERDVVEDVPDEFEEGEIIPVEVLVLEHGDSEASELFRVEEGL